ncbi:MAG TPA: TIGR03000 domain-containing protein [Gemmataceae bacterium]|jgi:uncharacterized protein (TIGR03000 family)
MSRSLLVNVVLTTLATGPAVAAPPPGYSAGPNPIFGSPGAFAPSQYSYPAPGTYGSTTFAPNAMPSLSGAVPYNVPLTDDWPAVASARVTVKLPADAKLWVDGRPTKQTGAVRQFVTPPVLRAGLTYQYTFRAEWPEDGRTVVRERPVQVRATGSSEVDFTKP